MHVLTGKTHFHLKPGSQKDILLCNDTNFPLVPSRNLKPSFSLFGSPPCLVGGLIIQGEDENPFLVGYREAIRHWYYTIYS